MGRRLAVGLLQAPATAGVAGRRCGEHRPRSSLARVRTELLRRRLGDDRGLEVSPRILVAALGTRGHSRQRRLDVSDQRRGRVQQQHRPRRRLGVAHPGHAPGRVPALVRVVVRRRRNPRADAAHQIHDRVTRARTAGVPRGASFDAARLADAGVVRRCDHHTRHRRPAFALARRTRFHHAEVRFRALDLGRRSVPAHRLPAPVRRRASDAALAGARRHLAAGLVEAAARPRIRPSADSWSG